MERDTGVCCQREATRYGPVGHLQNGSCKPDLRQDLNVNGLKENGHCNGMVSNGHVKKGSDHKNGFHKNARWKVAESDVTVNGYIESGRSGVVRRCRKDNSASKGGSSFIEESNVTDSDRLSEQSLPQSQQSPVAEHTDSSHIKVSFDKLLKLVAVCEPVTVIIIIIINLVLTFVFNPWDLYYRGYKNDDDDDDVAPVCQKRLPNRFGLVHFIYCMLQAIFAPFKYSLPLSALMLFGGRAIEESSISL